MVELYFNNFIIQVPNCEWTWSIRSCYRSMFTFANDDSSPTNFLFSQSKTLSFC